MSKLKAKVIDVSIGKSMVVLNQADAKEMNFLAGDRVKLKLGERGTTAIVGLTEDTVPKGEVGMFKDLKNFLSVKDGDAVSFSSLKSVKSFSFIRKKMEGRQLSKEEIYSIIEDLVEGNLSDEMIAGFLVSEHFHGMSTKELEYLTTAMADVGHKIDFERPTYEKHSIGGVPGNKVTLLIVPIVAAAGLLIPKTSSRAITSPSGTADCMSVLAPVEFTAEELKEIALKTNGAIVWGGGLNMAPADDIFIKVEHALSLDPVPQMLASIISKKLAVGTNNVVIDIPTGPGTKVKDVEDSRPLANQFIELGRSVGMRVRCGITYGGQPVGHAVGPALEALEALKALAGRGPSSLIEKSTALAGILLEMGGIAAEGGGKRMAKEILASGKALQKMREIIEAQGGNPDIKLDDIPVGEHRATINAPCDGFVTNIDNAAIVDIARVAGAPKEKGAGVVLHWKRGSQVREGEPLLEIYAEREFKLSEAYSLALQLKPITIEGMLLHEVPMDHVI